jgi:beta-glucosidase
MKKLIDPRTGVSLRAATLLPTSFRFGAATSAYQIEGAWNQDGRGPSIWEPFLQNPGQHSGDSGDVACDHYNRYRDDVKLMKKLGLDAYRFSIAWPRVMPTGRGAVNQKGLDFYDRLVDKLLEAGIDPFPTLYHWDLPQQLQDDYCGWLGRETTHHFADYADVVVRRLGDRVKRWTTFNEPEVIIAGYISSGMAPAVNRGDLGYHVGHHLMVAHGLANTAIRAALPDAQVGIVLNFNIVDPADGSEGALKNARERYVKAYRWYLDGLLNGQYPEEVLKHLKLAPRLPETATRRRANAWVRPGDMKLISQKLDFMGINYYTRFVVDANGQDVVEPNHKRTQMGWQIYPFGLARLMEEMNRQFKLPPMYITENGAALDDVLKDGQVNDVQRTQYIADHLEALASCINQGGVDIRGYFCWSFMDNLEWPLGFAKTFGLVHVDRANNLKRTPKNSARWYSKVIEQHRKRR